MAYFCTCTFHSYIVQKGMKLTHTHTNFQTLYNLITIRDISPKDIHFHLAKGKHVPRAVLSNYLYSYIAPSAPFRAKDIYRLPSISRSAEETTHCRKCKANLTNCDFNIMQLFSCKYVTICIYVYSNEHCIMKFRSIRRGHMYIVIFTFCSSFFSFFYHQQDVYRT